MQELALVPTFSQAWITSNTPALTEIELFVKLVSFDDGYIGWWWKEGYLLLSVFAKQKYASLEVWGPSKSKYKKFLAISFTKYIHSKVHLSPQLMVQRGQEQTIPLCQLALLTNIKIWQQQLNLERSFRKYIHCIVNQILVRESSRTNCIVIGFSGETWWAYCWLCISIF